MLRLHTIVPAALLVLCLPMACLGQKKGSKDRKDQLSGYDRSARATVVHDAVVYVAPDEGAQRIAEVLPGHEIVVVGHNGPWIQVFANTERAEKQNEDQKPEFGPGSEDSTAEAPASGWIRDKGVITSATPNGDAVLYGLAAEREDEASKPHAPKDAASEAHLLYRRVWEYFPDSPLAPESAFRAADIRWQMDKADISTLPSAHEQEAYLRPQLYEGDLKDVIKRYPGKYAALAAYDLLDNKLCGDWQGLPKCPEMEARLYMKYVDQYPESPKDAEAEYNAVYRQGVLVTMYRVDDDRRRAEAAAKQTQTLADDMRVRFGGSDWTRRAQSIAWRVSQNISIYGSDRD